MKKYFYQILIIFIINGCMDNVEVLKEIKLQKQYDYLVNSRGEKVYLQKIAEIQQYSENKYLIYDYANKHIYVIDTNFIIVKSIELKSQEYLFAKNAKPNIAIINKKLLVLDSAENIKLVDLNNGKIEIIKYTSVVDKMLSYPGNISIINDSTFVFAARDIQIMPMMESLYIGAIYKLNGELIRTLSLPIEEFDYNSEVINSPNGGEECYVNSYNNKIYFSFRTSKKVFVFDAFTGNLIKQSDLMVNDKLYYEPHESDMGFLTFPVTMGKLLINKNKVLHLIRGNAQNEKPYIMIYNSNFVPEKVIKIIGQPLPGYQLLLHNYQNGFLIQDNIEPLIYLLK